MSEQPPSNERDQSKTEAAVKRVQRIAELFRSPTNEHHDFDESDGLEPAPGSACNSGCGYCGRCT